MNRPLRRLAVARLALSLALVGPAAVHAEESPFPQSGRYGVVSPTPGASNYSGRFDWQGSYEGSHSARSHTGRGVAGDPLYVAANVAARLFPPLLLVMLPVAVVGLVVMGIQSSSASNGNMALAPLPHQADSASQESPRE